MSSNAAENTDHDAIVFFDGVCGLCNHMVNFLMAIDRQEVLKFAPLQGETAANFVPAGARQNLNSFVFANSGRLYYRSGALARILMRIGGLWRILGAMLWLIPWPLRDAGYRIVAVLRYRLFGKHESCRLPAPEERSRFLD
jgi:predicted DCC family thiol-disulfide oxidoreductase YuxK